MAIRLTLLCVMFFGMGCAPSYVRVRSAPRNLVAERLESDVGRSTEPGTLTNRFLADNSIECNHGRNCACQIESIKRIESHQPTIRGQFALTELRYLAAKSKLRKDDKAIASELFFDAAGSAYRILTLPQTANASQEFKSAALQLYNDSVENLLRLVADDGMFEPGYTLHLPVTGRDMQIKVRETGTGWHSRDFDSVEFAADYDIKQVPRHGQLGLGVPLIAVRKRGTEPRAVEEHYAVGLRFPCTAVLRFDNGIPRLELYDSMKSTMVEVADRHYPLSADITAPLARSLDRNDLRYLDTNGLLFPKRVESVAGLYMIQPFQPGKIPVLMVHGIWSSPLTWTEMINEFQSIPEIRDRYQFWFYLYPTAKPFWSAAADLREDLQEMRTVFDPNRQNTALDQMVVVGHSMGGLIGRMQVLDSGHDFWYAIQEMKSLGGRQPEDELRRSLFFKRNESVKRVVTIATPFRGSGFANRFTRWGARTMFSLPGRVLGAVQDFRNGKLERDGWYSRQLFFTSVDSLDPNSPVLAQLRRSRQSPHVTYHNIVGQNKSLLNPKRKSDGVVPISSAKMDDVKSQIFVEAAHSKVHRMTDAICEVRRVLLEHLELLPWEDGRRTPVLGSADAIEIRTLPAAPEQPILQPVPPAWEGVTPGWKDELTVPIGSQLP